MSKKAKSLPNWLKEPEEHDYPAAKSYLSLLLTDSEVLKLLERFDGAATAYFKAKDILRASRLELLDPSNKHVAKDLEKIEQDKKLSPVLLVRGNLKNDVPMTVADGYHRVCASYWTDENTDIPCKIVDLL